MQDRRI